LCQPIRDQYSCRRVALSLDYHSHTTQ
jgi:hypothetical protein